MKVRTKLVIGFSLIVVLMWLITFYAGNNYGNLQSQFTAVEEDIIPHTIAMTEVEKTANEAYHEVMKYVLYDVDEAKEASLSGISRLKEIWMAYLPQGDSSDVQEYEENKELMSKLNEFNLAIAMMINLKERGASYEELLIRDRTTTLPAFLDVQQLASEGRAIGILKLERVKTAFTEAYTIGVQSLFLNASLITLLAIGAAILVTRSIVRPLHALHKGTEMIAQGKLDYKVGTRAHDEIGQLSRAFDQMTGSLGGSMTSIDNLNQEIAERKRTEEALRESEEKYRNLFENSKDSISVVDLKGNIQFANKASVQLTGYPLDEGIGMNLRDMIPLKYWPRSLKKLREAIKGEPVPYFETAIKRKDGTVVPIESGGQAILKEGKAIGVQIIARDITERKRAEEALQESEEKFSKAFSSSPNIISIVNLKNHRFIDINDSFTRYTGYTREEVIGHTSAEVHIWAKAEERDRILRMLKEKGSVSNEEIHSLTKSGDIHIGLFSAEKINIGGEMCSITVLADITERKKREQLQHDENYVLTLLGQGAELSEILEAIVRLGESRDPAIKGSLLLYDSSREWLNPASGPSLPDDYSELMKDGVPVGPNMGSCGTAAYLKERVIVPDIENSPLFEQAEEAVKRAINNDLLACWSQPIIASNGDLLGTITNYSNKVGEPDADKLIVLEWSARIAAIAIERRRAEEALANEAIRRRILIEESLDGIVILDENSKVYEANQRFVEMLGYTSEEIRELHTWDWDTQWTREELLEMGRNVDAAGYHLETYHRRKDGTNIDVEISINGAVCAGQKLIFCVCRDITTRKRAEEALKESEEKFSKAFRSSPDAIAITTLKNGRFIEVNDSYTRITGYTREEVIGRSSAEFGVWAKTEERDRIIHTVKERGRVSNEEAHLYTKSGKILTYLFSAELINIGGKPCMISLATDITGRKRAEEELKNALSNLEQSSAQLTATNKELEAFSYSVSHDLRSPLRSIDGFSQALLEDYMDKLDENGQDYLRRLRGASQKMGELIDGLLKLSRLTRSEMRREKVDLSALAKEITTRLRETQPERHVDFVIGRGLTVSGDRQLLRVLMENLLGNAWKFTGKREQAKIEFGATQNGDKKAYFIKDNGAGFDMTYANKLFGAFQRLHETTEFPGTGIGLATVRRIINRHGGSVWAEGTEEKGATFYFTLN